jgi:hypothetical protein
MDARHAIHFARVDFRNDRRVFGIKDEDRFLHVYIIGKTGTGKSTLLESMALQDLERGNGFALIDPHGDLVARIAARVPASHRDRVIHSPISATKSALNGHAGSRKICPLLKVDRPCRRDARSSQIAPTLAVWAALPL